MQAAPHEPQMKNGVAKVDQKKTNGSSAVRRTVTVRAVMARLRRVLPKGKALMKSRPVRVRGKKAWPDDVGRFFVLDDAVIVEHHVDLDAFARKHEVLQPWEEIEDVPQQ
jgi:hypothetical protein